MAESDSDEGSYAINAIRAERWNSQPPNPDPPRMEYLIEWEGYAMHKSSFEPDYALKDAGKDADKGVGIVEKWNRQKSKMTQKLFQAFNEENETRHQIVYAESKLGPEEHKKRSGRLENRRQRGRRVVEDDDSEDDDTSTKLSPTTSQGTRFKYFIDIRDVIKLGSLPPATYVSLDHVGDVLSDDSGDDAKDSGDSGDGTDSSDDDTPLALTRGNQPQVKHANKTLASSQELHKDLFVDSQDSNPLSHPAPIGQPNDGLFIGPHALARAAPFHQSDEDEYSATDSSSESSEGKPSSQHKASAKTSPQANRGRDLGNSILSPKGPNKTTKQHRSNPFSDRHTSGIPEHVKSTLTARAETITDKSRNSNGSTGETQINQSSSSSSLLVAATTVARDSDVAKQRFPATSDPAPSVASLSKPASVESANRAVERRTGLSLTSSDPIRITNDPNTPKRKQWESDKHFSTLKFRRNAEVRARTEGNPDISALEFVGSTPSNLPKPKPTAPSDNVYGRREVRPRRMQEDSDEEDSRRRPDPMTDWEANKVPLVCYHWRLSNNCSYPASKCNFLHRNTDEKGRALAIGDENGYIPPKYRKPPVTCLYWLENPNGCSKTDRDCAFTHRNTGWKLLEGNKGEAVQIDPSLPPITERAISGHISPKYGLQAPTGFHFTSDFLEKKDLTCRWWLEASTGCNNSDADCEFAHRNTGWTLNNGTRIQLDPSLLPASERITSGYIPPTYPTVAPVRKQSNSSHMPSQDLTCYYWLEASTGCDSSEAGCKFAHRNTGWMLSKGTPIQLDPTLLPASDPVSERRGSYVQPKHRDPPVVCRWWLEGSSGCNRSAAECKFAHWNPKEGSSGEPDRTYCTTPSSVHRNTGWKLKDGIGKERSRTDPAVTPVSVHKENLPIIPRTNPNNWQDKTCCYWANGHCSKSDDQCTFRHYITDVVAGKSRHEQPKLVCRPFLEGRCEFGLLCSKVHIDPARLKGDAWLNSNVNPNFIPVDQQEQPKIQYDLSAQHDINVQSDTTPDMNIPVTASPLVERLPSPPCVDHPQESSIHEPVSVLQQLPSSTDLGPILPQARMSSLITKREIEVALKTEFTALFEWSDDGSDRVMLERRALLIFHPVDHQEELELLTRWLLMHHVEVSNAWFPGAWPYYKQRIIAGGSGIVIAHPSFEQFPELADIGQMLRKQVRLWSLGVQPNIEHDPAALNCPNEMSLDCIEIFPVGGLMYITENVFEEKPQLALEIIRLFCAKIDGLHRLIGSKGSWQDVQEISLRWRLCARPELLEYLFRRCEDQEEELEAGEANALARAELYALLSDHKLIEQDTIVHSLETKCDRFPIMSERRIIAEGEPLDYFNAIAHSPEEANARMIQYYGCMHIDMRRDYRHFYVVHTDHLAPCATRWKRENQVLTDVITPEQCIAELSKDGHDPEVRSTFDFYERYLMEPSRE